MFSAGGIRLGLNSPEGARYLKHVKTIIDMGAVAACMENVGNIASLDGGRAMQFLRELFRLEGWTTHVEVVPVRHYGDPNNKAHAFVIAFSNEEFGEKAKDFAFPPPVLVMSDENRFAGRDYAHRVVPKRFHRSNTEDKALPERNKLSGTLQKGGTDPSGSGA